MAEEKKNVQGKQAPAAMDINEQMQNRIDKMHKLEERGIRPFGHRFDWTHHTKEIYESRPCDGNSWSWENQFP